MGLYGVDAIYCVADVVVKPDTDSDLYKFISEYNKDTKRHYRHDNLVRGLCVNTCQEIVGKLEINEENILTEKFSIDLKVSFSYF